MGVGGGFFGWVGWVEVFFAVTPGDSEIKRKFLFPARHLNLLYVGF